MSKIISTAMPIEKANGITINGSLKCRSTNYTDCSSRNISKIVMHYTGNAADSAKGNANYFHNTKVEASAHYFVDDNSIYQSVDACDIAWHSGEWNTNTQSIGIEMCTSGNYKISAKTIENSVALVVELCKLLGISAADVDKYVIRHYDVIGKKCPAQMAGKDNAEWNAFKKSVKEKLTPKQPAITLPVLRKGDKGVPVLILQKLLGMTGDGIFGSVTETKVKELQKKNGSKNPDGVVGAWTWPLALKK